MKMSKDESLISKRITRSQRDILTYIIKHGELDFVARTNTFNTRQYNKDERDNLGNCTDNRDCSQRTALSQNFARGETSS